MGLKRPRKDIDAILWLYEGELFKPLQEREAPSYLKPLETAEYATGTHLRDHIVDLLTKALRVYIPGPVKEDSTVKMIFELDQALGVESDEALLEIESEPGQRLTVTKYPSGLTYPPHIYDYGQWRIPYEQLSDEGKQKRSAVTDKRRQIFSEHLQLYGERSIHSRESLTRYLQPKCKHRLSYERRVENVKHWIDLLDRNEHYEVGLAQEEQELELAIKNTVGAFLTGPAGEIHSLKTQAKDRGIHCGPWFVQWCDNVSIFAFFVDFEQKWAAIPEEWRNRTEIINWLRKSLSHSLTKRRRP